MTKPTKRPPGRPKMTEEERAIARQRRAERKQAEEIMSYEQQQKELRGAKVKARTARMWLATENMARNPIKKRNEILSLEDQMTLAMIKKAIGGSVAAYNAIMDRAYGRPKQEIETTNTKRIGIAAFVWGQIPEGGKNIDLHKVFEDTGALQEESEEIEEAHYDDGAMDGTEEE